MANNPAARDLEFYRTPDQCAVDLDAELDNLVFHEEEVFQPKTCFCCDCLLLYIQPHKHYFGIERLKKCSHLFSLDEKEANMSDCSNVTIPKDVIDYYKFTIKGEHEWLQQCVLSPNSCYSKKKERVCYL